MSAEQPHYTVLHEDGDIEYRQYDPYLIATTLIDLKYGRTAASNMGFQRLYGYISGARQRQENGQATRMWSTLTGEKIAMTIPLQQTETGDGWRISIMLPSKYTLETAPSPRDKRVIIEQAPEQLIAALRFSGRWTTGNYTKHQKRLKSALASHDIEAKGLYSTAVYNPPLLPPFMRRNEVLVPVSNLPGEEQVKTSKLVQAMQELGLKEATN